MVLRVISRSNGSGHKALPALVLKVAILVGLVFLLPLAAACSAVERRYRADLRLGHSGPRHRPSGRMVRQLRLFLQLSGLATFSAFLLSSDGRGPLTLAPAWTSGRFARWVGA